MGYVNFKTTKALRALRNTKKSGWICDLALALAFGFWFLVFVIWPWSLDLDNWNLGFGIWVLVFPPKVFRTFPLLTFRISQPGIFDGV